MMRKDISAKFLAMALSISMPAGLCMPAVPAFAAEESSVVQEGVNREDGVSVKSMPGTETAEVTAGNPEEVPDMAREEIAEDGTEAEKCEPEDEKAGSGVNEAAEETANEQQAAVKSGQFVLMNIPYDDFYKAEINNDVQVDAFTSATLNKTRTGGNTSDGLAAGSYHVNADGTDITGVIYPVKIGEGVDLTGYKEVQDSDSLEITVTNRGQTSTTAYTGRETLFENPSYSYYVLSQNEVPDNYKEVTVENQKLVFGKAQGNVTVVKAEDVDVSLQTETSYGDYGMKMTKKGTSEVPDFLNDAKVYGVVIGTDTNGYGLRHLENIWRKYDLAWCTGFTTKVHNGPTSSEHYKSMMGQTIRKVTYFTDKGIYEIGLDGTYIPVKFPYSLEASNAPTTAGSVQISLSGLPNDYKPQYEAANLAGAVVNGNILSYTKENAEKGQYTLKITDQGGKYASISTTFQLYVDAPVIYHSNDKKLVLKSGMAEKDFTDYVSSITSAEVNGKSYAASGRNSVKLVNEDGTLKTDAEPITADGIYHIVLSATGYAPVEFNYSPNMKLEKLEEGIQKAGKLKASVYTAASWKNMQTALTVAEETLKTASSQEEVDKAAAELNKAVSGLVKARPKTGTVVKSGTVNYQVKTSTTVAASGPSSKSVTKVSIPASIVINGYTYKVTSIANEAFSGCTRLKTATIGKNVATIGTKAFYNCKAVTQVTVSSTALTKIGNSAFMGCTAMTGFSARSAKLASIGSKAFYGDKKLKTISLHTSKLAKAKVGASAFKKIKTSCVFKVPSKKMKAYKKIFQAKGAGNKIKVKKI